MTIELPEQLESAVRMEANARGISPALYVQEVLERDLGEIKGKGTKVPFKNGYGMLAKYGPAPSAEEIDANRAEMFRNFGKDF